MTNNEPNPEAVPADAYRELSVEEWAVLAKLVGEAVTAVITSDEEGLVKAVESMAPFALIDVMTEMFLWVEDLTEGFDDNELLNTGNFPLPPNAEGMLVAIRAADIVKLQEAVGSDQAVDVFNHVLVLVSALKVARITLGK
jgi:hypothetical protein